MTSLRFVTETETCNFLTSRRSLPLSLRGWGYRRCSAAFDQGSPGLHLLSPSSSTPPPTSRRPLIISVLLCWALSCSIKRQMLHPVPVTPRLQNLGLTHCRLGLPVQTQGRCLLPPSTLLLHPVFLMPPAAGCRPHLCPTALLCSCHYVTSEDEALVVSLFICPNLLITPPPILKASSICTMSCPFQIS